MDIKVNMNRHDDRDMCLRVRGKCGVKRNWPTILDEEWVTWSDK